MTVVDLAQFSDWELVLGRRRDPEAFAVVFRRHRDFVYRLARGLVGDHVLAELGDKLNSTFADDMVVRFGGEEFCVLLKNIHADEILERAELLRHEIQHLQPANVDVTISIGLASNQHHPEMTLTQLLNHADKALYAAKAQGRDRVCA